MSNLIAEVIEGFVLAGAISGHVELRRVGSIQRIKFDRKWRSNHMRNV